MCVYSAGASGYDVGYDSRYFPDDSSEKEAEAVKEPPSQMFAAPVLSSGRDYVDGRDLLLLPVMHRHGSSGQHRDGNDRSSLLSPVVDRRCYGAERSCRRGDEDGDWSSLLSLVVDRHNAPGRRRHDCGSRSWVLSLVVGRRRGSCGAEHLGWHYGEGGGRSLLSSPVVERHGHGGCGQQTSVLVVM